MNRSVSSSRKQAAVSAFVASLLGLLAFGLASAAAVPLRLSIASRRSQSMGLRVTQWTVYGHPFEIAEGNDGSAWFTNNTENVQKEKVPEVERIDADGNLLTYPVGGQFIGDVARGPGGTWFVRDGAVGRIAASGAVEEFPVSTGFIGELSIAFGPRGILWLTKREPGSGAILRISQTGTVREFRLQNRTSQPSNITRGRDGAMWFSEPFGDRGMGSISPAGKITEFTLGYYPVSDISAGPGNAIWFGTYGAIGRLSPATGDVTVFRHPGAGGPVVAAPDGSVWFAQNYGKIGRLSPEGQFSAIDLPGGVTSVKGLALGADGSVWYTAQRPGVVGRVWATGPAGATSPTGQTPVAMEAGAASASR